MNSINFITGPEIARQQMARNAEAARTCTQRRSPKQPKPARQHVSWRVRWQHPVRARVVG